MSNQPPSEGSVLYVIPDGPKYEVHERDLLVHDALAPRPTGTSQGWAPAVNGLLERIAREIQVGCFVDVGAHIGLTTIPFARRAPKVQCYAFEPVPINRHLLARNVRDHNQLQNVVIDPRAVSDKPGTVDLSFALYNFHDNRVMAPGTPLVLGGMNDTARRHRVVVESVTLDAYMAGVYGGLEKVPRPVVLKVDVQGHEGAVLGGARDLDPDIVILEWWPYGLIQAGESRGGMEELLLQYDFGALLAVAEVQPIFEGHLKAARTIPWTDKVQPAVDLVMTKQRGVLRWE